jgi:3-dehydroquinate synthase
MNWNTSLEVKTRVAIGAGARQKLAAVLGQIGAGKNVLILCQPQTAGHWLKDIFDNLPREDYQITTLEVPDGEAGKNSEWLLRIWEHLAARHFTRNDTIVGLGGGAVCDLAGFACSTYLRGLNLVLLPTSLLAQVDASIGGKNGINLSGGKNLAGTFYFPKAVLADQELLSTLSPEDLRYGLAEIIKYALLEDTIAKATDYEKGPRSLLDVLRDLFKNELTWDDPVLAGLITSSIKMKLYVVGKDPQEANLRRCLNLGHTIGHALEANSNYQLSHGEAVAIGISLITKYAVKEKKIGKDSLENLKALLDEAQLPFELPKGTNKENLLNLILSDKKRLANKVRLVIPTTKLGLVDFDHQLEAEDLGKIL